jgi:hypothetical protein
MANSITPPPELVAALRNDAPRGIRDAGVTRERWLIDHAYAAGADQELEACCLLLDNGEYAASYGCHDGTSLRAARRPKPPSLKEQALEALERVQDLYPHMGNTKTIRRALEALPND